MKLIKTIRAFFNRYNRQGVPIPVVRDPQTGKGSITATMVVVSFGVALLLLAGKTTNLVGDVDYSNVLWLVGVSLGAYLGRKFQTKGKDISLGDVEVEIETKEEDKCNENAN